MPLVHACTALDPRSRTMAKAADKNGDVSKPLLPQKGAADVAEDECAGHRESALAYLIRYAAHIALAYVPLHTISIHVSLVECDLLISS